MITRSVDTILEGLGGEGRMDFTLERLKAALVAVGNPEKGVPSLIIGGTNGKGSTALFISSALAEAGVRVGTYLSPHLQSPVERFLLNLSPIGLETLTLLAREHETLALAHRLTYFEYLTLLYFVWAKEQKTEVSVLEVGLGGRLDSTNVTRPLASIVTNIALDHQAYLGDTHEKILAEKLGILPAEGLLFTGVSQPDLLNLVEQRCAELDAIYYYSKELNVVPKTRYWDGQTFSINGYEFSASNPTAGMRENAALAFLTLRIVFPRLSLLQIQNAFAHVSTPGRFETVSLNPRVVLSGDHNPHGLATLVETISHLAPTRTKILCGFSPDKPYHEMYAALQRVSPDLLLTSVENRMKKTVSEDYSRLGLYEPDPRRAVEKILQEAQAEDTILVTGSLYLVGAVRGMWHSKVAFSKGRTTFLSTTNEAADGATRATLRPGGRAQTPVHASEGAVP